MYRIHRHAYRSTSCSPVLAHRYFDGGRFDATDDDHYGYLYAGDRIEVAIAEAILRDCPADDTGSVTVPLPKYEGRRVSAIRTTVAIELIDLCGLISLRQASQDTWLTSAEPSDYPQTRHWGHWLRSQQPTAGGLVWLSKRDPTHRSYVLFDDRCPKDPLEDHDTALPADALHTFDEPTGLAYLRSALALFAADIGP
jgi:hypothetical protein